jgi:hypothetical protein
MAGIRITSRVVWRLTDGDRLIACGATSNLVTRVGDQMYAERAVGIASPPAAPTGMKLGTGSGTATKTGTGAALATYLGNSHQAFDGGFPASSLSGNTRRLTYRATWAPGKATTATAITEAVIVNEALTDGTSAAGATIARAVIALGTKAAGFTLQVIWLHDFLGA